MNRPIRIVCGKSFAYFFQLHTEVCVVESLARFRVDVQQGHDDRGRFFVVGNEVSDDAGALDIDLYFFDRFRGCIIVTRNYRPAFEPCLCNNPPACVGRPDGLHAVAVNAGHEEQLVVYFLDKLEVLRREYCAFLDRYDNPQVVAKAFQTTGVILVVENVWMRLGQHLFEAGLQLDFGGLVTENQGRDKTQEHHYRAVVEHELFQECPGVEVEFVQVANDGQVGLL